MTPQPMRFATVTAPAPLQAYRAIDLIGAPRPDDVIEGVAWAGCLTVLVSESGTGKTFLLLSAAAAVSAGTEWLGRVTKAGSVAYLSYEGDALGLRLQALRDVQSHRLQHIHVLRATDPLSPVSSRDGEQPSRGELEMKAALRTLVEVIDRDEDPPIRLVIVDTVRASMSGSEDSSEHVAAYLRAVRRVLSELPGAAAVLAHHAGWQDGESQRKRERGSSAWRGNCDGTLYLEAAGETDRQTGEARLTLRTLKVRDGERWPAMHIVRRRVELMARTSRGEPETSCVIEPDRRTEADREAATHAAVSAADRATDLRVLQAIHEHPEAATSQDRLRPFVGVRNSVVGASLDRLVCRGWVQRGARQKPFTLTADGVEALGVASS